jgi:hypothetical protein
LLFFILLLYNACSCSFFVSSSLSEICGTWELPAQPAPCVLRPVLIVEFGRGFRIVQNVYTAAVHVFTSACFIRIN